MSQHKMNIQDIIFLMMYIFIWVYLFIKMLMTSCFVCATLNLVRKKSTGTEPLGRGTGFLMLIRLMR